jgi:hypothetical protein
MAPEALAQAPADTTACPFALPGPPKRAAADDGFEQVRAAVPAAAALRMRAIESAGGEDVELVMRGHRGAPGKQQVPGPTCSEDACGARPGAQRNPGLARVVGAGLTARGAAQSWRWQAPKRPRTQSAAPSLGRPGVAKDDRCTVYVKNLPYGAEEADVVAHFEQAGRVADVRRGVAADGAPSARPAVACSDPYPDPLPALGAPGGRPARRHELWPPLQSGCWRVCTADRRARELPRRMH